MQKVTKNTELTMPLNKTETIKSEGVAITMEKEFTQQKTTFVRKSNETQKSEILFTLSARYIWSLGEFSKRVKSSHQKSTNEQRRVFLCGVLTFIVYLFAVSWLFAMMVDEWDYFTAFYFLFNSVALIGEKTKDI